MYHKILRVIISLFIILSLSLSIYNVANAVYYVNDHYITITTVFIPHSNFGTQTYTDFQSAMDQWNDVLYDWRPLKCHPTNRHSVSDFTSTYNDGRNYICRYNTGQSNYLMLTHTRYNSSTGETLETDVNVNMYFNWSNSVRANRYDVWTVFVHEMGHVMGLAHQNEEPSVMKSTILAGEGNRYLYTYDINLCRRIYDY